MLEGEKNNLQAHTRKKNFIVNQGVENKFHDQTKSPKIHKPNNQGSPIISACSCPTELISSYLDKIMAPIVKSLPSYIKDSQHALEIFCDFNFLGEDQLIFTMDISSLYTVIPNSEGLQELRYFFDQRTVTKLSSETLLRLAEPVLTLRPGSDAVLFMSRT